MHNHNDITLFDLSDQGLLSISGENAKKFLQGQLTCNLDDITESQPRMGAHCNPQGRIISLFRLFLAGTTYYMQMPRELVPIALPALQKYAVFFKVQLIDASNTLEQIGYMGNELPSIQAGMTIVPLSNTPARCILIGETAAIAALRNQPGGLINANSWKSIDMAQYIPAIYPETSEKFLPHDLNLPGLEAVSFNKGCYTGQEIIARMHYRGKLKNRLYRAKITGELNLQRGHDIYCEGKNCGSIVDFCQVDYNSYELLIIAQEAGIETNTLTIDPEKQYPLEIIK